MVLHTNTSTSDPNTLHWQVSHFANSSRSQSYHHSLTQLHYQLPDPKLSLKSSSLYCSPCLKLPTFLHSSQFRLTLSCSRGRYCKVLFTPQLPPLLLKKSGPLSTLSCHHCNCQPLMVSPPTSRSWMSSSFELKKCLHHLQNLQYLLRCP